MSKARKKIWVTQTLPRAVESAKGFKALGLEPIISPVLEITFSDKTFSAPNPETALIFTSRNGVRAFCAKHEARAYQVFCVGEATAQLAKAYGFADVISAGGNAADIISLVSRTLPKQTPVLHCAGRHVRGFVTESLEGLGYQASRLEYYASSPVEPLNMAISQIDYVALYSPFGADVFSKRVARQDLSNLTSVSMSGAVDEVLRGLTLKTRLVASHPAQSEMLQCLRLDLGPETGLN